jgi:hypothetical protein
VPQPLDWRREELYPKPEDLTPQQWAWEFLRRNHLYRQAWRDRASADYVQTHFGLTCLLDPSKSAADLGDESWIPWKPKIYHGPCTIELRFSEAAIVVNKVLSIPPQLKHTASLLKEKSPRGRYYLYPLYLRLLDAAQTGGTPAEIAAVLYPNAQTDADAWINARNTTRQRLRAAQRMCDIGWRALAPVRPR